MRDKDMYNTYDGIPLPYHDCFHFNTVDYLNSNNPATYVWDFQDTVNLRFDIDERYKQFLIKATIYNFRGEPVLEVSDYVDDYNIFYLNIDHTLSTTYFTKGTYSIAMQAITPLNEEENYVVTILPKEVCTIHVR